MNDTLAWVIALPAAYLIGSVPIGIITGKVTRGVDIRKYGSGSTGATNILRTLGPVPGVIVLALDWSKGAGAVFLARALLDEPLLTSTCAAAVIAGHSWPVFAGFRGGKGVATGLGALTIIWPLAGAFAASGLIIALVTRYVSLGSIIGTAAGLVSLIAAVALDRLDPAYLIFAVAGFLIIELRHWSNFRRLLRGTESRLFASPRPKRARVNQA
jgi:glycerol-3-phosphate acyltransferase PlsY